MQVTVENCIFICIHALQKSIRKSIEKRYPDPTMDQLYEQTKEELQKFTVNDQFFECTSMKNHLGGHRWFFLCPKCKKQASKLFLPPKIHKNKEPLYLCKACHKLKNQSALMGQNNMYRRVTRPLKRMKEIEDKIGKGHLKQDKVQALLNEYENIEKQLKECPEYRLYTFKKKHNLMPDVH